MSKDVKIPSRSIHCTDHCGNSFPSLRDMCAHWGVSYDLVAYRVKRKGMSLREALETGHPRWLRDHRGRQFTSVAKLCEYYRISHGRFYCRRSSGLSMREILTSPHRKNIPVYDQKTGRTFPSLRAAAMAAGISPSAVRYRVLRGLPFDLPTGRGER